MAIAGFITVPVILAYEACLINGHTTKEWRYFLLGGALTSAWVVYRFSFDLLIALPVLGLSLACLIASKILIDRKEHPWWRRKLTSNDMAKDSFDRWHVLSWLSHYPLDVYMLWREFPLLPLGSSPIWHLAVWIGTSIGSWIVWQTVKSRREKNWTPIIVQIWRKLRGKSAIPEER